MGPRSHERGNVNGEVEIASTSNAAMLQWGRVLMNAETCRSGNRSSCTVGARFNGAAFS